MTEPGDDGLPWGYVHGDTGAWIELPKGPGLIHLGPPPFDVTLPDGRTRRIVHNPAGDQHATSESLPLPWPPRAAADPAPAGDPEATAADAGGQASAAAAEPDAAGVRLLRTGPQAVGDRAAVTGFATAARVRLTPGQRAAQAEIGDAIGVVHGEQGGVVEVEWPRFRSWHKVSDLEPAP
ncbi:MAG TPA: hypothetical protein VEU08_18850 [Vicinamibacterales bacterium]|nr:hypothetical protein [Vicinamibacterales bacterium]